MTARGVISGLMSSAVTSPGLQRARGAGPRVDYFHQADDPYSQLTAQLLPALRAAYDVDWTEHAVSAPSSAAAPEPQMLYAWALRDAALLAEVHGLAPPHAASDASTNATDEGDALRARLGHYLGATFHCDGCWYWGVDRLPYLEAALADYRRADAPIVRWVQEGGATSGIGVGRTIDFFLSFRSPYTYLAAARVRHLAERTGAKLRLRYVLPMVMRGLPVPADKRLYIVRDTKREADRHGLPFGRICDPVGIGVERGLAVLDHAIAIGKGSAFAESFLQGVFAEAVDAASDGGLHRIAARAGLDAAFVRAALRDDRWRAVAEANRSEMFALGLWGVPSFRVDDLPPHWGQDRLWAVERDLVRAQASAVQTQRA